MKPAKFEWLMVDLEEIFDKIAKTKEKRDAILERYYERLGDTTEEIMKKAVNYLLDNHGYRRFPLIAEIVNAIRIVSESPVESLSEATYCDKCNSTGFQIHPVLHLGHEYPTAFPCECETGQMIKRNIERHNGLQEY